MLVVIKSKVEMEPNVSSLSFSQLYIFRKGYWFSPLTNPTAVCGTFPGQAFIKLKLFTLLKLECLQHETKNDIPLFIGSVFDPLVH